MSHPWALLPPAVNRSTIAALDKRLKAGSARQFMKTAGLQYRLDGDRVTVRADRLSSEPMVLLLPLQTDDGAFRQDAGRRLEQGILPGTIDMRDTIADYVRTRREANPTFDDSLTLHQALQLQLMGSAAHSPRSGSSPSMSRRSGSTGLWAANAPPTGSRSGS